MCLFTSAASAGSSMDDAASGKSAVIMRGQLQPQAYLQAEHEHRGAAPEGTLRTRPGRSPGRGWAAGGTPAGPAAGLSGAGRASGPAGSGCPSARLDPERPQPGCRPNLEPAWGPYLGGQPAALQVPASQDVLRSLDKASLAVTRDWVGWLAAAMQGAAPQPSYS